MGKFWIGPKDQLGGRADPKSKELEVSLSPVVVERLVFSEPTIQEKIVYVDRPVLVEKEVEVIKYVDRSVEVIIEKIVEVLVEKEVVKEVEVKVPYEVIKYVASPTPSSTITQLIVEKEVYKVPPIMWGLITIETITLIVSIFS